MNNGVYRFFVWMGSQMAAPYFDTTFQTLSFAGNVLAQIPMFFLVFIGVKERKWPLLLSGALSLSISIVLLVLNREYRLFLQVSSSLVLFTLSLIVIRLISRRESADLEVV